MIAQNISWRRSFGYEVNFIPGGEMWWTTTYNRIYHVHLRHAHYTKTVEWFRLGRVQDRGQRLLLLLDTSRRCLSGILHDSSLAHHPIQQSVDSVSDIVDDMFGTGERSGQVRVIAMETFDTYVIQNAGIYPTLTDPRYTVLDALLHNYKKDT